LADELSGDNTHAAQHREFVQADVVTDLPNEVMSALSQGLSQFGVQMPGGLGSAGAMPPTSAGLASSSLTGPGPTSANLTSPGLNAQLTAPNTGAPPTDPALTNPALTNPALSGPTSPGVTSPGVTTPSEVPVGLDPGMDGSYPIYGDPSMGGMGGMGGSGGIVSDVMSTANQMGLGQLMDLLKGAAMPSITQAMQGATQGAAAPAAPPAPGG
jgi:hypothetical protein